MMVEDEDVDPPLPQAGEQLGVVRPAVHNDQGIASPPDHLFQDGRMQSVAVDVAAGDEVSNSLDRKSVV